jgi:hypothetical protein
VPDLGELWLPLVDEPIGSIVDRLVAEDPELALQVERPRRILAFRTLAYLRAGIVLGRLLFEAAPADLEEDGTWVDALACEPACRAALVREVRAVAAEIAADPEHADDLPFTPDDESRERFRAFAREHLTRRP